MSPNTISGFACETNIIAWFLLRCMNACLSRTMSWSHCLRINRCDKTSFVSMFSFVVCTLLAQTVLTLRQVLAILSGTHVMPNSSAYSPHTTTTRIHAITAKNIFLTSGFIAISVSQLVLGVYLTSFMAVHPGRRLRARFLLPLANISYPAKVLSTGLPYDAFNTCVFTRHRTAEVAYTSISLGYGKKLNVLTSRSAGQCMTTLFRKIA